jgi:uncharacterized membrane protein SirB2
MGEFYSEIWAVHVGAVAASGVLFLLRGLALFAAAERLVGPLRYLSYTSDTVLLTAALMLMTILRQYPFVHGWLTVKVVLLAVYIGLGVFAFQAAGARTWRRACWLAALAVYAFIISVARAHDPWGILARGAGS